MDDRWNLLFIGFPIVWIVGLVTLSIIVRRRQGRPIFPRRPPAALFAEFLASGGPDGMLSGARNCLLVTVERDKLTIVPIFPFNLMFVGDIFGLDIVVPRHAVVRVERRPEMFRERVVVHYRRPHKEDHFVLYLRDPAAFEQAMNA
ncbi:hypothetical protein [Caulobacter sp. UNC279MFTsu5.1]|uniref:hypothetical protein n=1 Tax=Caulobacter sp. UNC279MFTsu5.1 TaxID=1502775 RepID=UPI00036F94EB|nr:hypothetical protein [Caulobacter sp. UNC279MFTsu5.1]SFK22269.1 hypothetical protein SAMN02799626_03736 [Caulobacter sp. UNC279MFTsu5.1]